MDANRFDTISKLFAHRKTRRAALKGTGIGVAVAAVAPFAGRVAAQGATPAASSDSPHSNASPSDHPEYLFVQPFASGTWEPGDEAGAFTLTLSGAAANTIYFSDRPERIVGLSPTDQFLDQLGFTPANPPNAALVAPSDSGDQDILIIELFNPRYDGDGGTLTYDAKVLDEYLDRGLAHLAQQQTDYQLPGAFGEGGLFIDDCADSHVACIAPDGSTAGTYWQGNCYSFPSGCAPCQDPTHVCASKFGECLQCERDSSGMCITSTIQYLCTYEGID